MAAESDWPALGQLLSMSRATTKMPKLDTLDELGDDALTTILTRISICLRYAWKNVQDLTTSQKHLFISEWLIDSPTRIQEMLAHLKMFDKDLKKIWQRFNKPWAGIDIIMLVRLTILKMLTMLTMLMILTTNLDNKSWQQILTANLDDRFWQPISWIDCWLPYSALFRVTSATIFT